MKEGAWQRDGTQRGRTPAQRRRARTACLVACLASLALADPAAGQAARPSPSPQPVRAELDDVVAELREINATLGALRTEVESLGARLDRLEEIATRLHGIATPMREEVRGLYVETSNVRSEIARLEAKSADEENSLARSRYVLTLLLVATAVLQIVVLVVLLRSR